MSSWGRALAGFTKGATGVALDNIKANQEEDRAIKRAQMLERLRRETSDYEYGRNRADTLKAADKNFSGIEGEDFVYRNTESSELSRRKATQDELWAAQEGKTKFDADQQWRKDQLADKERDRAASLRAASMRSYGRGGADDDEDTDEGPLDSVTLANRMLEAEKDAVDQYKSEGYDLNALRDATRKYAATSLARGIKDTGALAAGLSTVINSLKKNTKPRVNAGKATSLDSLRE